ncbi:MAG TPA: cytochrome c [Pseudolabrys sp.]|jgi:mono/diheme cytochrome c family protein|nr:cytochrome c [Pseudolabrys sp.]
MKTVLVFVALLCLAAWTALAQGRDPIRHGRALAKEFCARCHAVSLYDRSRNREAPPLRTLGRTVDLDQFARALSRGLPSTHPDMPQFKFHLDDARDLRDYLRTIQE